MSDLDFADLQNNFARRTYTYESDRAKLGRSNPRLLNWIGSIDYSGYVREKCLKYLIDNYQLGDENRILLRLEDWVTEIQAIAFFWTKQNFCQLSLEQIHNNYRLILYLARKERLQNSEAITVINSCLLDKVKDLEASQFNSLNSNFRKYLYPLALPENHSLRSFIIGDKDPNNRLLLLKFLKLEQLTSQEIAALKQDKCSLVKRRFIYYQLEQKLKLDERELIVFALDKNKGVREIAAYYLKRDYEVDTYQLYKQRTDEKFYYIADYARKEDLDYFLQGLRGQNKQIKLLCLKAVCNIDANYLKQFDLKELILENNKFKKIIIQYLGSKLSLSELEIYREFFLQNSKGELIYLNLLAKTSYDRFINYALDVLIQEPTQENINCIWKIYYQKATFYQKISPELKTKIISKIDRLKNNPNHIIQKICKELEFIIISNN